MIKILLDIPDFLLACAPLLTSTAIFTLLTIALSKSIKNHAPIYYAVFAIPFLMVAIPTILKWCGVESTFSFTGLPVLGQLLRDYIHMGTFGHPLLIVIMYMGALDTKIPWVKRLMSIRKELSIISGFPVLTHSLIRVAGSFPNSLKYFTAHDEFVASGRVVNEFGAGLSNTSLVLGIVLLALFIPLWITSFDGVHRSMGGERWKKLQRWAYLMYAVMFIHAMGMQVGGMLNPRGGNQPKAAAEIAATGSPSSHEVARGTEDRPANDRIAEGPRVESAGTGTRSTGTGNAQAADASPAEREGANGPRSAAMENERNSAGPVAGSSRGDGQTQAAPQASGRNQTKGLSDLAVGNEAKRWIHLVSLLLIYGSYLFLRLRKARNNKRKRNISANTGQ